MKNKILMAMAAATALVVLAGCSSSSSTADSTAASSTASSAAASEETTETTGKADGVYTAQMDDASAEAAYGWRDELVVEYKDGKIVSATFESYDADGNKKSETTAETYPMDPSPADWMPELSENIVKAGTSSEIDGITGATLATNNAKAMLAAIEAEGEPDQTIVVSEPEA
ncbi:FMN-binding protein [Faecalibacterium sp. An122]|uniref:FMN-binding protein n=1 Tax=Faecalibacterium sp. An122 TaxID=1965551 RepID=UPI000B37562F|nr:FMN-binding protein [Faecalibacterium sp. An122]OUQ37746.1 hypothetical protein B5E67_07245 [Faecalibacterium sp. An122]